MMLRMTEWIHQPRPAPDLSGSERFVGTDATVTDFWRYALRDLRSNTTRGILAEWLVTRAVGSTQLLDDWHEYDVITPTGVTIECKASAYLQAWEQRTLTSVSFSGLKARTWSPSSGYSETKTFNADVYVFCLQTAQTHDVYDALNVAQWSFYVLPNATLQRLNVATLTLGRLARETQPVPYAKLADAVASASEQ